MPAQPRGIFFVTTIPDPRPWLQALRTSLAAVKLPEGYPPLEVNLYPTLSPGTTALSLMASFWAGVDKNLADPTFPRSIPLVRMVDPEMTRSMAESCLLHSLWSHRQLHLYNALKRTAEWNKRPLRRTFQPLTEERVVGILGLGTLGRAAATVLARQGFQVLGWARSRRPPLEVVSFDDLNDFESTETPCICKENEEGFDEVMSRSEILINLLPLTDETRNILGMKNLSKLPQHAVLVNLARGAHVVEDELISALDKGILSHAILDVFVTEPLPSDHALWNHPKVTITPHVSALTNPRTAGPVVAETIRRHLLRDGPLLNVVDHSRVIRIPYTARHS
ncbi:hypothetical protein BC829DRAFT_405275 [Chytridium lagenaria]|nr:hypothetical protein BC829DRAFT_405275 [Chytridium lagenaria]